MCGQIVSDLLDITTGLYVFISFVRSSIVKNRSNFGEFDVAPAKNDKVNKMER